VKNILKTFVTFLFFINSSCQAQQMVQTTKDIYKLKENEQQFINKPLKNLLKEIKPEIKTATGITDNPFFFSFKFRTLEQQNSNMGDYDDKVALYVYVKELFDWNYEKRPKGNELKWTKEELEKYGNLTVIKIKVANQPKQ
jgi:hypothetical protein